MKLWYTKDQQTNNHFHLPKDLLLTLSVECALKWFLLWQMHSLHIQRLPVLSEVRMTSHAAGSSRGRFLQSIWMDLPKVLVFHTSKSPSQKLKRGTNGLLHFTWRIFSIERWTGHCLDILSYYLRTFYVSISPPPLPPQPQITGSPCPILCGETCAWLSPVQPDSARTVSPLPSEEQLSPMPGTSPSPAQQRPCQLAKLCGGSSPCLFHTSWGLGMEANLFTEHFFCTICTWVQSRHSQIFSQQQLSFCCHLPQSIFLLFCIVLQYVLSPCTYFLKWNGGGGELQSRRVPRKQEWFLASGNFNLCEYSCPHQL